MSDTVADPCAKGCDVDPVPFDRDAAAALLAGWKPKNEAEFIMGNPASAEIRKRWPRLQRTCRRCGQTSLTYASYEHYTMGDW